MKKLLLGLFAGCLVLQCVAAEKLQWLTDLPTAQAKAKKENKIVMLDFTGSDWCSWCKKLNKEVFNTSDFADYAAKNVVLVEVDFPRQKPQTAAQKTANQALMKKYSVQGYPTVIVLDGDGAKVGELGYQEGGPKPFISELQKLKK